MFWLSLVLALVLLTGVRAYTVLARPLRASRRQRDDKCSLAVFLGSGGHTSEAILLLETLDFQRYTPRIYLMSDGDALSAKKAIALEKSRQSANNDYRLVTLPRARHVHQSFLSTPPTFLKSLLISLDILTIKPALRGEAFADVMILNGPGTCVPVCIAAYISRVFGFPSPRLIYIESFARVRSLSLSGKLLRRVADRFIVQWTNVLDDRGRGECRGWLV